jgi:glycine/D-amino acid oxidase-like deaminating enzyme
MIYDQIFRINSSLRWMPMLQSQTTQPKSAPYWWNAAPREKEASCSLPAKADVVIVGSGFTGLSAALRLAEAGRSVVVLDSGAPGCGASTRNMGFISRALKHSFGSLVKARGEQQACNLYAETRNAFDHLMHVIERYQIECHLQSSGRVRGAMSPAGYESMAREVELRNRCLGDESYMLPRDKQSSEVSIDLFHGVQVIPDYKSLHPGLLHDGILREARRAGALVLGFSRVTGILRDKERFEVTTVRGKISAHNVLLATNGYTTSELGDWYRRVIPFDAFIMATQPLADDQIAKLLPTDRATSDAAFNLDFLRSSPDRSRLLFGGLTGSSPRNLRRTGERLRSRLVRYLPSLSDADVEHCWTGRCAGTFDMLPHVGQRNGIFYAMGYCFAGVSMGTYLGQIAAEKILGNVDAKTAFDDQPFDSKPYYFGQRSLVSAAMTYYNWKDRRSRSYMMP